MVSFLPNENKVQSFARIVYESLNGKDVKKIEILFKKLCIIVLKKIGLSISYISYTYVLRCSENNFVFSPQRWPLLYFL